MHLKSNILLCIFLCALLPFRSNAQGLLKKKKKDLVDTSFIKPYAEELTGRLYLSQKYTSIRMPGSANYPSFTYRPNTSLNIGIGATYRSFTLNLAYGFSFLNNFKAERGKTRYLDLQGHFYPRKFAIDFFGQFYKGYYISPKDFVPGYPGYYYRPDLRVRMVGFSSYYIFNNTKFSYRASMIQNERQTKSAGTFLVGGDIYYGTVLSDSTLVPSEISNKFPQGEVNRFRFFKIGPGVGYAYSFVYKQHWFASASITLNTSLDFIHEDEGKSDDEKTSASLNYMIKAAAGYNSRRWIYSVSWVNSSLRSQGSLNDSYYALNTGNYRLTVARRFTLNHKTRKFLKPAADVIEAPKKLVD